MAVKCFTRSAAAKTDFSFLRSLLAGADPRRLRWLLLDDHDLAFSAERQDQASEQKNGS